MTWLSYQHKQKELGKEINCVFKFRRAKRVATHSTTKVGKIENKKNICCTAERCITSWADCSQFTTRIPSKLAYIRHSDQNWCSPPTIIPEFKQSKNDQKSLCVNKRLTPPTINCKLKPAQKTSPQHQQILSNKNRVLPLFMWQWSADASRGVAYHIHLVQQVIVLILSMVLATCSGASYLMHSG